MVWKQPDIHMQKNDIIFLAYIMYKVNCKWIKQNCNTKTIKPVTENTGINLQKHCVRKRLT